MREGQDAISMLRRINRAVWNMMDFVAWEAPKCLPFQQRIMRQQAEEALDMYFRALDEVMFYNKSRKK